MKKWYKSKTIWLAVGQLLIIWASCVEGKVELTTTIALSMTFVGGIINRYFTSSEIEK